MWELYTVGANGSIIWTSMKMLNDYFAFLCGYISFPVKLPSVGKENVDWRDVNTKSAEIRFVS